MKLWTLAKIQLRVGSLSFGGPMAAIAMMRSELVERTGAISQNKFLEGLGLIKLLPGPIAVLMSVFLGAELGGALGGIVSALCFILPSFFLILSICFLETVVPLEILISGPMSEAMRIMQGAVLGIVFHTCFRLFRDAQTREYSGKTHPYWVAFFGILGFMGTYLRMHEAVMLLICAFSGFVILKIFDRKTASSQSELKTPAFISIFLLFFYVGLTVFGTGYMVLPALERELVLSRAWITPQTFLDGVVYGNLTPGPITIASTYFGFKSASFGGAVAATLGIFGAPIALMLILGPIFRKHVLGKPWVEGALMGLLPAVATSIALAVLRIVQSVGIDFKLIGVTGLSLFLSVKSKWAPWKILVFFVCLASLDQFLKNFGIAGILGQ